MLFRRTCQNIAVFNRKGYFSFKCFSSRYFNFRALPRVHKKYSRHTQILLTSAALGLSVYIACKRIILCETAEIVENEELNTTDKAYDDAIRKSRDLLLRLKDEVGAPGLVVGVSVDGESVWTEGFGYADVENRVLCTSDSVMRIASISKSITMAAVAKLMEQGKIDLDKAVQDYVPYFPSKTYDGKPVTITCRQLVSHLGGIRHYDKSSNGINSKKDEKGTDKKLKKSVDEFDYAEYYIKENFKDMKSSLDLFKDDPLIANPGSKFHYSTHGWTLISAIVEAASKEPFPTHMTKLFKSLGMSTTYLDLNDVLIYHRSRNYRKNKNGYLINVPYVDNSYKWAGGGFLSTVGDLLQFGNAMLYSFQFKPSVQSMEDDKLLHKNIPDINRNNSNCSSKEANFTSNKKILSGYLNSKTVETLWTPVTPTPLKEASYGMGWCVQSELNECFFCESRKFCAFHTGAAVGASSVLLIAPQVSNDNKMNNLSECCIPKGIIVVILINLQSVSSLSRTALKIVQHFENQS